MKKLTLKKLEERQACSAAKRVFKKVFPKGTYFSEKDIQKALKWMRRTYSSHEVGSWVRWAVVSKFVSPTFWRTFHLRSNEARRYEGEFNLRLFAQRWRLEN